MRASTRGLTCLKLAEGIEPDGRSTGAEAGTVSG